MEVAGIVLMILAGVCFILAGLSSLLHAPIGWQWFGVACLVFAVLAGVKF